MDSDRFGWLQLADDTDRVISTKLCRFYCRRGDKEPSDFSWAEWRRLVGVDPSHKTRPLTMKEALLLCVRSRLRSICKRVGMPYPSPPLTKTKLMDVANAYVHLLYQEGAFTEREDGEFAGLDHLNKLALFSDMSGAQVLEVIRRYSGESSISLSTIQRRLIKAGEEPIRMRQRYRPAEVSRKLAAVARSAEKSMQN
jgi:hypothetical protein